jgi:hypothetical protein
VGQNNFGNKIPFLPFSSWWLREHIPINEAFDNQTFTQIIFAAEDDTGKFFLEALILASTNPQ